MSPLPRLTVNLDGPTGRTGRVFLDGIDITAGLQRLSITFAADSLTVAEMTIGVGPLEIDAQTLAILQANVEVTVPEPTPDELTGPLCFGEPAHA